MSEDTTAIEKKKADLNIGPLGYELKTLDQAYRYAKIVVASGLAPKNETPEGVLIKIEYGQQLGLSNMSAIQNIANINGRPSIFGDAAIGLVRKSGLVELFEETVEGSGDDMTAICRTKRKGEPSTHERTFSVEDAKRANLWGKVGPWSQYPKRMLQMRARGWAIRDVFPDVIQGLSIAEEARDIPGECIDIPVIETQEKTASKTEGLEARIKARISATSTETTKHPPEPAKTSPEPETTPSREDLAEPTSPVDEEGKPLDPQEDIEEARRLEDEGADDPAREKLVAQINEMRKYRSRTFAGYVGETCANPEKWASEMTIDQLQSLAAKLDASKK